MRVFELMLSVAAPLAAAIILARAGSVLNRMRWRCCTPLLAAYAMLTLSAFAVMVIPFYGREASALGYPGFIISAAAVLMCDRRLRHRER
jgi:hypothetical protein